MTISIAMSLKNPDEILAAFHKQFVAGLVLLIECEFVQKADPNKYLVLACVNPRPLI